MHQPSYHPEIGALLRGILNGFKHTPETIAPLIGIDVAVLNAVIAGATPFSPPIETALLQIPGINQRDFYSLEHQPSFPIRDDTDNGVLIRSVAHRRATERTLSRGPNVPYYTYADTAMSTTSTFRPEWIQELYIHDGKDADLPDWAFNKGHFEHQVTYFIGTVNFYWIDREGHRHVRQMHTGDVNYIVPFVPHTFTTREPGEGLILAVTYGGALTDPKTRAAIQAEPVDLFVKRVVARSTKCVDLVFSEYDHGVLFKTEESKPLTTPLKELFLLPHQPTTGVHLLELSATTPTHEDTALVDRWVYNLGETPVQLSWNAKKGMIEPGGSAFIQPHIGHRFSIEPSSSAIGRLLIVDTKPDAGNADTELALTYRFAGEQGVRRSHTETTRWY